MNYEVLQAMRVTISCFEQAFALFKLGASQMIDMK